MDDINLKVLSREEKERIKKAIKKKKNKYAKKEGTSHEALKEKLLAMMSEIAEGRPDQVEEAPIFESAAYEQFREVFEKFEKTAEVPEEKKPDEAKGGDKDRNLDQIKAGESKDDREDKPLRSKKYLTRTNRMSVAQLKVLVQRPDLVEAWDVTASDPLLLIHLKGYKNTVEVPKNWIAKKKTLDPRKGFLKRTFKLPDFIENTGIAKLRDPLVEKSSLKMVRQKLKERMNPRLGKIDIDYEVLHDAFFKYQTKPQMTGFGDIYYEGKEEDQKVKTHRPGHLSAELRAALGISSSGLPPWIMNMQKFGSPPSYPNLKIPGLSSFGGIGLGKNVIEYGGHEEFEMDTNYVWGELKDDTNNAGEEEHDGMEETGFAYRNEYLQLEEIGGYEDEPEIIKEESKSRQQGKGSRAGEGDPYKVLGTKDARNKGLLSNDYIYNVPK